jgi:hypothetical protein
LLFIKTAVVTKNPTITTNRLTPWRRVLKIFFNWYSGGGIQLVPLGTATTNRPIVPGPGDYDDGEIGGMIGRGN